MRGEERSISLTLTLPGPRMSMKSESGPGERGGGMLAAPGELGSGAASSDRSDTSMSWALRQNKKIKRVPAG